MDDELKTKPETAASCFTYSEIVEMTYMDWVAISLQNQYLTEEVLREIFRAREKADALKATLVYEHLGFFVNGEEE